MQARLKFVNLRGFSHSTTSLRGHRGHKRTKSQTAKLRDVTNTTWRPVMGVGSASYSRDVPFLATALNPAAPNFNPPPQQNQSFYTINSLGQANAILNSTLLRHPSTAQNPNTTMGSRRPPASKGTQNRDQIIQPSPESGGVPDPTPEYLALASHPPFQLPHPRHILVVVDLNGTLLHRPSRHDPTRFVERPFARAFLSYCINTFTVVIWSSARPDNVKKMCAQLLKPEDRAKVVAIWGRDSFRLSNSDYNQRVLCYKRLTTLWNDPVVAASHPKAANGEKWSQLNTVLVDDSIDKARSEPFNLIQVPEFAGDARETGRVLPQIHDYLNECSQQSNVSAYIQSNPFKVDPKVT
ncbi:HAD-like domain-containing protein [Xylaria digitata]|nr:HAD-like domain-containing protein [Xylaria digitata]